MEDCIFCKITSRVIPSKILFESDNCIAVLDAFPLAAGHTLVMPKRHCKRIQEMHADDEGRDIFTMVQNVTERIESVLSADAMIVMHNGPDAGQAIQHAHIHVIPRTAGDSAGHLPDLFGHGSTVKCDADAMHAALVQDGKAVS